jgi:hypothetical protein
VPTRAPTTQSRIQAPKEFRIISSTQAPKETPTHLQHTGSNQCSNSHLPRLHRLELPLFSRLPVSLHQHIPLAHPRAPTAKPSTESETLCSLVVSLTTTRARAQVLECSVLQRKIPDENSSHAGFEFRRCLGVPTAEATVLLSRALFVERKSATCGIGKKGRGLRRKLSKTFVKRLSLGTIISEFVYTVRISSSSDSVKSSSRTLPLNALSTRSIKNQGTLSTVTF